jgi:putative N6-adenine-specific DNA methylase
LIQALVNPSENPHETPSQPAPDDHDESAADHGSEDNSEQTAAQLPEFFAVVTPGLELLAANELIAWFPGAEIEVERGGFTFYAPLEVGCELNRYLKIPTRILLRLTSFTCRDFPKLFKKTMKFPWENWVAPGSAVDFQASSHGSRLFVKKRIEETCDDGYRKHLKEKAPKRTNSDGNGSVTVLVRLDDDVCTFSLDTSGEILHKRGTRSLAAEAPIRETIASALLFWMIAKAGDQAGAVTLVDPMMGSGTFFLEANGLTKKIEGRDFAFEGFPALQRLGESDKGIESNSGRDANFEAQFENPFRKFIGRDLDPKAIEATLGNLKPLMKDAEIEPSLGDIFDAEPMEAGDVMKESAAAGRRDSQIAGDDVRWLIANPPYGERLKVEGSLSDYYAKLFEACERFAKPEWACFVLPEKVKPLKLRTPKSWKVDDSIRFQNGGIPVVAVLYRRG